MKTRNLWMAVVILLFFAFKTHAQFIEYTADSSAFLKVERTELVLAFGSCNKHNLPQPLWGSIVSNHPDLWVWMGDNIYGDSEDMEVMRSKYRSQFENPGYVKMRSACPVAGTWDDHDYGVNDGGKEYPMKEESKKLLLDFLQVDPRNKVFNHAGVYNAVDVYGKDLKVKLILLDTRSFRDSLIKENDGIKVNPKGDILGEAQWLWLEKELQKDADVFIIGSSIQLIPEEHPYEKWGNFPASRDRFFKLIDKYVKHRVIIVSGDRHMAEISTFESPEGVKCAELTTSGLTHVWTDMPEESNKYRMGEVHKELNFGLIRIDGEKHKISIEVRGKENKLLDSLVWENR